MKKKFIKGKQVQELFSATNNSLQKEVEFLQHSNLIEGETSFSALEEAKEAWEYLMTKEELTIPIIKGVHNLLMRNRDTLKPEERGIFRHIPVYIGGKLGMNPKLIDRAMEQWVAEVNDTCEHYSSFDKKILEDVVKRQHIDYEKIHPFVDGNGRTGRMFMNWTRLKIGLPLLIIHQGGEQQEYYKWFQEENQG